VKRVQVLKTSTTSTTTTARGEEEGGEGGVGEVEGGQVAGKKEGTGSKAPPPLSSSKDKEIEELLDEKLALNEALARRQEVRVYMCICACVLRIITHARARALTHTHAHTHTHKHTHTCTFLLIPFRKLGTTCRSHLRISHTKRFYPVGCGQKLFRIEIEKRPVLIIAHTLERATYTLKRDEPSIHSKVLYIHSEKPCIHSNVPFIYLKEPNTNSKQPFVNSKGPCKPRHKSTRTQHLFSPGRIHPIYARKSPVYTQKSPLYI